MLLETPIKLNFAICLVPLYRAGTHNARSTRLTS